MTSAQRLNRFSIHAPDLIAENTGLMNFLTDHGFFTAPASTKYHGAYEGGLFDHSMNVYVELDRLTKQLYLKWSRPESPFIVGMFHDLCKIDQYMEVEDDPGEYMFGEDTPRGRRVHYEHADPLLKGHGEKSIMLLSQFMTLNPDELYAIRYHMGAYEREDWDAYGKVMKDYPVVLYTHTADMTASHIIEVKENDSDRE